MSLIKGPFTIKVDDKVLNNVTNIVYSKGKLGIDMLVSDFDIANFLLEGAPVNRVYCIGCNQNSIGATYRTKKYITGIVIEEKAVMKMRIVFDVWDVTIGEIS